jgi:glycerol kinase
MSKTWKRKTNTKYKHITTSPNNSICYKIKEIAREMKKRKEKKLISELSYKVVI